MLTIASAHRRRRPVMAADEQSATVVEDDRLRIVRLQVDIQTRKLVAEFECGHMVGGEFVASPDGGYRVHVTDREDLGDPRQRGLFRRLAAAWAPFAEAVESLVRRGDLLKGAVDRLPEDDRD